ncbi:unnamed protein product [Zymoseptoria tritici ST99CH_3D7]|uniref:Uncharacterized protein n=1 Tax=Zymoseptoria tritici (strain ST99CH_3D7) TaxID=1276538 RepID=A0A1X7RCK9_ZYMT9|nr:unnamed protein product [Zymoseptoria tritici ST99CH_3D7]
MSEPLQDGSDVLDRTTVVTQPVQPGSEMQNFSSTKPSGPKLQTNLNTRPSCSDSSSPLSSSAPWPSQAKIPNDGTRTTVPQTAPCAVEDASAAVVTVVQDRPSHSALLVRATIRTSTTSRPTGTRRRQAMILAMDLPRHRGEDLPRRWRRGTPDAAREGLRVLMSSV